MTEADPRLALEAAYHADKRRVLATLIRLLGGFDAAEEAVHDAFAAAAEGVTDDRGRKAKVKFVSRLDYHPFKLKEDAAVVRHALDAGRRAGLAPVTRTSTPYSSAGKTMSMRSGRRATKTPPATYALSSRISGRIGSPARNASRRTHDQSLPSQSGRERM